MNINKKTPKVLYLVSNLDQGGLETYLLRFLNFNTTDRYSVVVCKSGEFGQLYDKYLEVVNEVIPFRLPFLNLIRFYKFYVFLSKSKFDTICDFTGNFAGFPLFIARLAKVKKRLAFYRGATNHFKESRLRLLYNSFVHYLVSVNATKILSNSQDALDYFYPKINRNNIKFEVIYNGIDINTIPLVCPQSLRKEFNIPDKAFVVGHTGRVNYAKNHDTIIKVAMELCRRHKNIYFVLIGKGVDESFSKIIEQVKLNDRIRLYGYRNDILRVIKLFDLFYFPSITEGQPNSLIEAMVAGIPFVASNIPSIKESVPEKCWSWLLPPLDVELAINEIEFLYFNKAKLGERIFPNWAIKHYDANKLFGKFSDCL